MPLMRSATLLRMGISRSCGTFTPAIMYLKMRAWCSNSAHWPEVNGARPPLMELCRDCVPISFIPSAPPHSDAPATTKQLVTRAFYKLSQLPCSPIIGFSSNNNKKRSLSIGSYKELLTAPHPPSSKDHWLLNWVCTSYKDWLQIGWVPRLDQAPVLKTVLKTNSHRLTAAGTTHIATKHKPQWSLAFFLRCRKKKTTQIWRNPGAPTLYWNRAAIKPPKQQKTRPTPRAFFRQAASSSPLALVMP